MFRLSNLIYLYFIALAFAPIVSFLDYETVNQGFYKIYGATLLIISFALLLSRGVNKSKIDILILAAAAVYFYYLAWDIVLNQGTLYRKGFVFDFFVNPYLHTICLIYVVDNYTVPKSLVKILINIFKGTVILAAGVSTIQFLHDSFFFTPDEIIAYTRQMGSFGNDFEIRRMSIFGYLGMLDVSLSFLPILGVLTAYYALEKKKIPYGYLVLGFIVVFANNSRYAQLGYFITWLPMLVLSKNKWRMLGTSLLIAPIAVGLFVLVLNLIGFDVQGYIQERVLADSATTRLLALEIFNKFFGRHPWFGSGVHLSNEVIVALAGRSSQIHVGYLAHLYSYGIIGSFLVFSFWLLILKRFYRTAKITAYWGSVVGILVFLWANVTLVTYQILTYGIMMSFLFNKYYLTKSHDENNQNYLE